MTDDRAMTGRRATTGASGSIIITIGRLRRTNASLAIVRKQIPVTFGISGNRGKFYVVFIP